MGEGRKLRCLECRKELSENSLRYHYKDKHPKIKFESKRYRLHSPVATTPSVLQGEKSGSPPVAEATPSTGTAVASSTPASGLDIPFEQINIQNSVAGQQQGTSSPPTSNFATSPAVLPIQSNELKELDVQAWGELWAAATDGYWIRVGVPTTTKEEKERIGKAIHGVIQRRSAQLNQWSDVIALGVAAFSCVIPRLAQRKKVLERKEAPAASQAPAAGGFTGKPSEYVGKVKPDLSDESGVEEG